MERVNVFYKWYSAVQGLDIIWRELGLKKKICSQLDLDLNSGIALR